MWFVESVGEGGGRGFGRVFGEGVVEVYVGNKGSSSLSMVRGSL